MVVSSARGGPGRPRAASRDEVERTALGLMLRDGYDAVSVDAIAAAAGIGRTTFFRYFGSKPGVIWVAFDATIERLHDSLRDGAPSDDSVDAARAAVVASTRAAIYASDVWLERFKLLDDHPSLRAEAHAHWERWRSAIADHVGHGSSDEVTGVVPAALAGAFHGVFVAELRNWRNTDDDREAFLARLDGSLARVGAALRPLTGTS